MHFSTVDNDPKMRGKKKARKTTRAGGQGREELMRIAQQQNAIIQQEKEELVQKIKAEAEAAAAEAAVAAAAKAEAEAKARAEAEIKAKARAEAKAKLKAKKKSSETEKGKEKQKKMMKKAKAKAGLSADSEDEGDSEEIEEDIEEDTNDDDNDLDGVDGDQEESVKEDVEGVPTGAGESQPKKQGEGQENIEVEEPIKGKRMRLRAGPLVPDTVIGKISVFKKEYQSQQDFTCVNINLNVNLVVSLDPGVYFTCGLCDVTAILGANAELVCKLSSEECDGVWYKDGKEVRRLLNKSICL